MKKKNNHVLAQYGNWVLFKGITGVWIECKGRGYYTSRLLKESEVDQIVANPAILEEMAWALEVEGR